MRLHSDPTQRHRYKPWSDKRLTAQALAETTWAANLPMYALPEMEAANSAFLAALRRRLRAKGVDTARRLLDGNRGTMPDGMEPDMLFTQVCGYPWLKRYRNQYRMLAKPHYALPGRVGSSHQAFFMVRTDDPAQRLEDLRGRIFGCNDLFSNSGMNLPRLSLARVAGGQPFFASVTITGAHIESLARLADGSIDVCSIDNVTWGLFKKFRPEAAQSYRILDKTISSPSLPFVTSARTTESETVVIAESLYEIMNDPLLARVRSALELTGLSVPDVAAYERLADYEREATELGFAEIR